MTTHFDTTESTETALVRRAQGGDLDAFEKLLHRHQQGLRFYLTRRLGDVATADDLAQDVLLTAFRRMGSLRDASAFSSWLLTIARNRLVDHVRRMARKSESNHDRLEVLVAKAALAEEAHDDLEQQEQLRQALRHCLSQLGGRSRSLVQRFYFQNESAVAIADDLGQNGSTVRMTLLRIRRALAKCIHRRPGGPV